MPSPLHDAASTFFYDSAHASLVATLDPDVSYAAHGVALTMGAEVTGFCGLPGLSGRSRKVPDFALLLGFRAKFPGLAVEVGFAESFAALVQDAGLLLLGTAETTRVVVVVKLYEGAAAAHADMPWPADVAVPPVEASVAVKEAVEARLQDHLLDTAHVASLVGAITGEAAVYTRLADVALISSAMRPLAPGTPAVAVAEEADCPGIACVYRYTFMTDDIPAGVDAVAGSEQALDTDTPLPWVLTFPLAVLHPAEAGFRAPASLAFHNQQDPVLGSNSSGIITFDLLALAKHINRRRPHMEVWRAKYIAAGIMERWHIQTGELRNQQHAAVIQQQPQPRPPLSSSPLSQPRPPLSALPLSQVSNNTDNTVRGDGKHNLRPKRLASTTHPRTSKNETWATYKKAKLQTSEEGEDGEADENDAEKKVHNDDDDVDDDPDWLP
ncbi:hypothetical protein DFH27DRAFT_579067 [Peziza echinospora]|nr:hypothetical protein DFH27DRAFT_579067 [Peziza echinospora]